jgi:hypothetical protein
MTIEEELSDQIVRLAYRSGFTASYGQWADAKNPFLPNVQKLLHDTWESGYEDGLRKLITDPPKQDYVLRRSFHHK